MDTEDRVQQVNWIRELAGNMVGISPEGQTAEQIVEYALSDEGSQTWLIDWPAWFDAHDKGLLTRFVRESLDE